MLEKEKKDSFPVLPRKVIDSFMEKALQDKYVSRLSEKKIESRY